MKYSILFISCVVFLFGSCQTKNKTDDKSINERFNCLKGLMKSAWYEHGIDERIPPIKNVDYGFIILVDTNFKATNFISFDEDFSRKRSKALDTTDYTLHDNEWEKMTSKQKLDKVFEQKLYYKKQADSAHIKNNLGQNQVWVINNTTDTVSIQMQDWSYICILQGLTKSGQWLPIQYWRFSNCGNSYYDKHFLPKTANSFITTLPNTGNYQTKLRFKLLGTDKFYYSNEFTGKINYCDFVEDSLNYDNRRSKPKPHYKLDTLIHLSML
ncbi:hypothetical protein [Mucilaginibacter arboris]|uniref:Lipoprotein n=1 Tax=Mucilaginibacter arboris TaxID=2682090 RepID=A0A7K1T102_9SPHI|nr:hypothetical protein [Mucilaginibacter arboris]MVN23262.1 hypothetical protein [Mucilaginibacter arboris]